MIYKLWKTNGIYVEVSIDDLKEYYKWLNDDLKTTKVLEVLNNNVAEYEDLMNEYAMIIERKKIMDTHIELIHNKMHSVLKYTIEQRCINHFKASYGVYDRRLRRCKDKTLKLSYFENKYLYIESCYKSGVKCGHSYLLEKIIIDLIGEIDYNAIFYDACNNLSEDSIIRNSTNSNSNYFEYVLGYIKDVYNIPKINGFKMANAILAYFGLGEDFDDNFNFNVLKKNQSNVW